MILTDYLRSERDITWDYALQCGVTRAVIRLPETDDFDVTDPSHWETVCGRYRSAGLAPLVLEPLPNELHDHIKAGDDRRDECLEKAVKMFPIMAREGITTLCFNFMAYIGWTRTTSRRGERGGALVTAFDEDEFETNVTNSITREELWRNYLTFLDAVLPAAGKYGIRLALHPDDPPLPRLAGVERLFISFDDILRGVTFRKSDMLGVTLCQACYRIMGEDLHRVIPAFADLNKLFFIHFRDVTGNVHHFRETFHDNGDTDMADILRLYRDLGVNVPIRVDHVPAMAGEDVTRPGYDALGRLFAIGYLKGLCDALDIPTQEE